MMHVATLALSRSPDRLIQTGVTMNSSVPMNNGKGSECSPEIYAEAVAADTMDVVAKSSNANAPPMSAIVFVVLLILNCMSACVAMLV